MKNLRKYKKYCLILILSVFVPAGAAFVLNAYGFSYYYQKKFENIYQQEFFPNNEPAGYYKIINTLQNSTYWHRQILKGIHALSNNRYQDRWGNFPIQHKIIEFYNRFPDDIPALITLINDASLPERTRLKAKKQFASLIADNAERELKYLLGTPVRLADEWKDILIEITKSEDYDSIEMRCSAMRALGAAGVEEAIPILVQNTKSSPNRVRLAAYQSLINISRFKNLNSNLLLRNTLLSLLKTNDQKLRIEFLDSLPELTQKTGMIIDTNDIILLLEDTDNDIVYRAIHILERHDEAKAINKIISLAGSPSPDVRRLCRTFLEQTKYLSPEQLLPLAKNDSNDVRVLALAVAFKQNAYGVRSGQFQRILLELEKDSDKDIALVAGMYLGKFIGKAKQEQFRNTSLVQEKLFTRVFDPPRPNETRPQLTQEEYKALQEKVFQERKTIINKANDNFLQEAKSGINAEIYQLLIDKFATGSDSFIIVVPKQTDTGGLHTLTNNQVILSKEQANTVWEDYHYVGPGLYLSEIFINSDRNEARIEVTTYQAPLSAQGWGITLKRESGKWTIVSKQMLWIS